MQPLTAQPSLTALALIGPPTLRAGPVNLNSQPRSGLDPRCACLPQAGVDSCRPGGCVRRLAVTPRRPETRPLTS
ncbi:uncharacterized protein B0I36DRAFT_318555 [Microdochium trichocladiopsis]|uniref:Uncharacterized protein n=1 Tax=Microdochium trichocladiopsis TaxID=1682393 RepID=A0A9P9BTI7_9PEZI|nr:uncharacterized protein B0I36DRAFT_318555 [Microdochium trichocladiopsis]KAH7035537.1 hypothetical protein B0I36DRAFT_318555 [Microdochium trichocladiopsis]